MTDPVPPPEQERTCPNCKKPVPPGQAVCDACGTRLPSLVACSRCGTQFVNPKEFCDLCGGRLVPVEGPAPETVVVRRKEEIAETVVIRKKEEAPAPETVVVHKKEEVPAPEEGEDAGPAGEEAEEPAPDEPAETEEGAPGPEEGFEPEEETVPEPGPAEAGDADLAAIFRPKKKNREQGPPRSSREIVEPDTAELLATYGSDIDDDAAATAKKPAPWWMFWSRRERPQKNADEALFLSGEKPARRAQKASRKNRVLRVVGAGMMLAAVLGAVILFGLPLLAGFSGAVGGPGAQETPGPEPTITATATPTVTPTPASGSLIPRPTQTIPGLMPDFRIHKNLVTYQITVIFVGSSGEGGITRADITVTHPDGSSSSRSILPLKGIAEADLNGSEKPDRVQIDATVAGGTTYHVYDSLLSPGDGN